MDELSKEIASLPSDVLSKAYDDALHPVLSSVGDTLSLVPRTVGVLLGPWKKWVVNGESNIEEAIRQIEEKMEDVPEDCFCEPAQNVVVPAIQQLSYSYDSQDLRGLYVNLLASSMDKRVSPLVHPSFVSIIGQLTPDEAKMMSWLSEGLGKDHIPVIDLRVVEDDDMPIKARWRVLCENYTNVFDAIVQCPENVSLYLNNLERLKLLNEETYCYEGEDDYLGIEDSDRIRNIKKDNTPSDGWRFDCVQHVFRLTPFGKLFIKCCV